MKNFLFYPLRSGGRTGAGLVPRSPCRQKEQRKNVGATLAVARRLHHSSFSLSSLSGGDSSFLAFVYWINTFMRLFVPPLKIISGLT